MIIDVGTQFTCMFQHNYWSLTTYTDTTSPGGEKNAVVTFIIDTCYTTWLPVPAKSTHKININLMFEHQKKKKSAESQGRRES